MDFKKVVISSNGSEVTGDDLISYFDENKFNYFYSENMNKLSESYEGFERDDKYQIALVDFAT